MEKILNFISQIAFKIYSNQTWWTKPDPEGVRNLDALEIALLFVLPLILFLWALAKTCI